MEQFLEIYELTNHLLTLLISFQLTTPILLKYSKKQFSTKPPEETKGLDGGRCVGKTLTICQSMMMKSNIE
jgi:hypothetical protein